MSTPSPLEFECSCCGNKYAIKPEEYQHPARYCPFCGSTFKPTQVATVVSSDKGKETSTQKETPTLIQGIEPQQKLVQFTLGSYKVLSNIGRGGMGEVFLAYDTICGRRLALKRIRPDLIDHAQIHRRFLKEARITSQLTHPAIIPIYAIHSEKKQTYYTMPFVEGSTLKQILRKTRNEEKKGIKSEAVEGSIPFLSRIFLSVCQAIAYAHSKDVLHRDIKPENIIVGKYGEVLILDWGLAKIMRKNGHTQENEGDEPSQHDYPTRSRSSLHHITHIGKVVGTIPYMAPERALGKPANIQTDIYSLGVILYQILTLKLPFQRGTLKEFRQNMHLERLQDPAEIAPYRDVPKLLAQITMKCLQPVPDHRYRSVSDLIRDLETYIEGRAEWFAMGELNVSNRNDWEFQENVLIAEHTAITRHTDVSDWVSLMISKASFSENLKIETEICIGEKGQGIGFLLSIPEVEERVHLNDGYCLWLASDLNKSTKLLRSSVEVLHAQEVCLLRHEWHKVRIEKMENKIHVYINDQLLISYISHLPVSGTHMGLLARDADFQIKNIHVYVGNQSVMINCLAVPDAFLAHHDYATALAEYRRIGYSFPGRAEGREGMFRAGITILEQAKEEQEKERKAKLFDAALEEFEKLHNSPGAPLEYLGKALVYQAMKEYDEEIKCFELAYRRYPNHPLLPVLKEQIIYRMHESARNNRKATFYFSLLAIRHIPKVLHATNTRKLFSSLRKHWEFLPFFHELPFNGDEAAQQAAFALRLAFWLDKPYVHAEIVQEQLASSHLNPMILSDALFAMIELGQWTLAAQHTSEIAKRIEMDEALHLLKEPLELIQILSQCFQGSLQEGYQQLLSYRKQAIWDLDKQRLLLAIMERAIDTQNTRLIEHIREEFSHSDFDEAFKMRFDACCIWAALFERRWEKAFSLLQVYPIEKIAEETSLLHFLYGILLYVTEGKEIAQIHFSSVLELSYPRTWMLFAHFFNGKIHEGEGWSLKAFPWEKKQLFRQQLLFYHCIGDEANKQRVLHLLEDLKVD